MRLSGWLFLVAGWGLIIWLTAYCVVKVFKAEGKNKF